MVNLIWVAAGGALGACLRYISSSAMSYIWPNFPYGTMFVNILGSFFIGLLMNYLENKIASHEFVKYFLIIGLLGSYTTFSAFSYDTIDLFYKRNFMLSTFYVIVSVSSCLLFAFLGYSIKKL